jgi:hypothetical protein
MIVWQWGALERRKQTRVWLRQSFFHETNIHCAIAEPKKGVGWIGQDRR